MRTTGRRLAPSVAVLLCGLALTACSRPDAAALRSALVERQEIPSDLAGCMAPQLIATLDSDSVRALTEARVETLPAEDAAIWSDTMAACADVLGYVEVGGQP